MLESRAPTVWVATAALAASLAAAGLPAMGQDVDQNGHRTDLPQLRQQLNISQQVRQHIDVTEMAKTPPLLSEIAHALPGFVAGACALIVVGRFLGIFQMGPAVVVILLAVIGGIGYGFYWHH